MTIARTLEGRTILLVVGGGIAAYKSLDLVRRLRERGARVRTVMTAGAGHFVSELTLGALAADKVFTELFDREDEQDVGHIRLAREADAVVVAPATANLLARMAHGLTNDLATAVLLATRAPILLAPAMNPAMWNHPATKRNVERLQGDGVHFTGPGRGEMAEAGEAGTGRMSEPLEIVAALEGCSRTAPSRACAPSSHPGRRASRSTRCAPSPTAPPASRATRWRRRWRGRGRR